ncbi:MAG: HD-GYP domain-containing protein [Negativicutes bacterium]|nr:HD-GYP domain-containing protein [Negativicutes bacterium]
MKTTILLNRAEPGMLLFCPIVNEMGKVILAEGTVLTEIMIARLQTMGVSSVEIQLNPDQESDTDKERFDNCYHETLARIADFFETIRYFKEVPLNQMQELVDKSLDPMLEIPGMVHYLSNVQQADDYTFHHSLSVAAIAGILGKWSGQRGEKLKNIILAGLLHDIGKLNISTAILNKPSRLTADEQDMMRRHSTEGYRMLAAAPNVSQDVLLGVLQHHERRDGSGYPMGRGEDRIHYFAKIIAIADIYTAMTATRVYRDKQTPFDVVREINRDMYLKLDPELCLVFLNNIRDSLVGNVVMLNDGRKARVISAGSFSSEAPVVITEDDVTIDLDGDLDLRIVDCFSVVD